MISHEPPKKFPISRLVDPPRILIHMHGDILSAGRWKAAICLVRSRTTATCAPTPPFTSGYNSTTPYTTYVMCSSVYTRRRPGQDPCKWKTATCEIYPVRPVANTGTVGEAVKKTCRGQKKKKNGGKKRSGKSATEAVATTGQ